VAGSPMTYPKLAIEPIKCCSNHIRARETPAGQEPFSHRRRFCAAYALAQYSCQARVLSSHAFRIWSRTFMRWVTARDTRNAKPRIPAPHAVVRVGSPVRWPVATAQAVRIALTITNVTEPAIRRVIQPITGPWLPRPIKSTRRKSIVRNFGQRPGHRGRPAKPEIGSVQLTAWDSVHDRVIDERPFLAACHTLWRAGSPSSPAVRARAWGGASHSLWRAKARTSS